MRADRLVSLILLLQTRGKLTAQALADELGVARRTILRDVEALSFAGIPVYTDGGHGGGIALDENYRVKLTGLKEAEARALFLSSSAKVLGDIGLEEAAESTLLKLFAALPALHQPSVDYMRQRVLIDPVWWWHSVQPLPYWEEIQQAVYEDRCIQVVYENYNGEVVERILEPFSLVAKASIWYLIARRDGELRTYRVARFRNVTLLDARFERPPDFDLAAYWQEHLEGFGAALPEYAYRFTVWMRESRLNGMHWYYAGRAETLEPVDEHGRVTMRFRVESLDAARMFVLDLGADVIILEPPELRDLILNTARTLLENHAWTAD